MDQWESTILAVTGQSGKSGETAEIAEEKIELVVYRAGESQYQIREL
ncbi:MAG: hypothetical protein WD468_05695 [Pirellulales bacterium]